MTVTVLPSFFSFGVALVALSAAMAETAPHRKSSRRGPLAVSGPGQAMVEIVEPIDIDRLTQAFRKFEEFKRRLLTEADSILIAGKQYLRKSAWRKWALACGVSDEIVSYERIPPQRRDEDGNFLYRFVVRAFHNPTGRSAVGVAVASSSERKNWAHIEHDVMALSHTRAKNRAIADLVGGGEISAEEVPQGEATETPDAKVNRSPAAAT